MQDLIEAIVIRTQQNSEIAGGLNHVQTEIEDNSIINVIKKT